MDILLTCAQTNATEDVERVEAQVTNNRGLMQEIVIPPGVAYADVEDQPDYVRTLVRTLAGGHDVVLLPPGKRLSVGFTRPAEDREVQLVPRASALALATDLAVNLAELASLQGSDSLLVALLVLQDCAGADGTLLQGVAPSTLDAMKKFTEMMGTCLVTAGAELANAVSLAEQYVSLTLDVPLSIVKSDRSFSSRVEHVAGRLHLAATLIKGADLVRAAAVVWEGVAELIGREVSGTDPAVVRLKLTALSPLSTHIAEVRPVTGTGEPAAGWTVVPEYIPVSCGDPSPASVSDNVHYCSPTAAAADVCWPRPDGAAVLCLRDPWETTLHELPVLDGATTQVTAVSDPAPLGLELADGTRCRLRNGGSWSGHPEDETLAGFYWCPTGESDASSSGANRTARQ